MTQPMPCPSEDEVACFLEGRAESVAAERIRIHLDACSPCQLLVASALRAEATTSACAPGTSEPRTFSVGEVLNRRFRIDRFVAKGGMGEVYEAWDLELRETVALKTIVCTGLDNSRLFPRIRSEVHLARKITHPNVCRLLDFGVAETEGHDSREAVPFFTMEYLHGSTLRGLLKRRKKLGEAEVVALALQILDGLSAVHAAGIVHRDLKPENVFVVPTNGNHPRAVVMDFGLARSIAAQDLRSTISSDAIIGTPAYMAPEQVCGGEPTPAWDIYALGVIAFELLSGVLPFTGRTALAMAVARACTPAPSMASVLPDVHPMLRTVVGRCLQKDPEERFATADAAHQAFARVRLSTHALRWRLPVKVRLVASLFGGVAILTTFGIQYWQRNAKSRPGDVIGTRNESVPRERIRLAPTAVLATTAATTALSSARDASLPTRCAPALLDAPNDKTPVRSVSQRKSAADRSRMATESARTVRQQSVAADSEVVRDSVRHVEQSEEVAIPSFAKPSSQNGQRGPR